MSEQHTAATSSNSTSTAMVPPGPSRDHVDTMFDGIAARYDLANRVLSMRLDVGWRQRLLARLPANAPASSLRVLDVATGTADLAIAMAHDPRVKEVVGVDVSTGMLAHGRTKVSKASLQDRVQLHTGDARELAAYIDFDVVTISFGIRNVGDTLLGLRSMLQTLKPGGSILVLEFSEPQGALFGPVYRLYRRRILPKIGGLLAGDTSAYQYLDETISSFPAGDAFADLLKQAGFVDVGFEPLTFGAVTLYRGTRPKDAT